MNVRRGKTRQVYNKKALQQQSQKQQYLNKHAKKRNIIREIIKEIDNENDLDQPQDKANNNEEENQQEVKEDKKKEKPKTKRLKLDANTLLYDDKGLRRYYETITTTEFNSNNDENNLNKLITLFRNWHFMLFPNYDVDFFTNKLSDLGTTPPIKAYLSRLRRIHTGEADWNVMYDEQNMILGKASLMNETNKANDNANANAVGSNSGINKIMEAFNKNKTDNSATTNNRGKGNDDEINWEDPALMDDIMEQLIDSPKQTNDNNNNNNVIPYDDNEIHNVQYDVNEDDYDNISFNHSDSEDNKMEMPIGLEGKKKHSELLSSSSSSLIPSHNNNNNNELQLKQHKLFKQN